MARLNQFPSPTKSIGPSLERKHIPGKKVSKVPSPKSHLNAIYLPKPKKKKKNLLVPHARHALPINIMLVSFMMKINAAYLLIHARVSALL